MFGVSLEKIFPMVMQGLLGDKAPQFQQSQQQLSQMSPQQRVGMTSLPAREAYAAAAQDAFPKVGLLSAFGPSLAQMIMQGNPVFSAGIPDNVNVNLKDYATGQMSDQDRAMVDNLAIYGSDRTKSLIDAYMQYYNR